ncbi:MAG: GvpL/GvpF family gas vesicle protein [Deltaproteobacteria bacterium]|nr:GvpL/GvpF family gas vesicle protein [Deltaproteobacteria bacterium]
MEEGNYIYCIIGTDQTINYGPLGIGGRGDMVSTLDYQGIACVVSRSSLTDYILNRENLMAHQLVIEKAMKGHTVLPVRFSTIAASAEDIRGFLRKRHVEFRNLLLDMDNKVELGLKVMWKDMSPVFGDIANANKEIKRLKDKIDARPVEKTYNDRISLGRLVKEGLAKKKEDDAEDILSVLNPIAVDMRTNKLHGDNMLLNAAFLVDGKMAKEFDSRVQGLGENLGGNMRFKYVGPVPPYNFVNIVIELN